MLEIKLKLNWRQVPDALEAHGIDRNGYIRLWPRAGEDIDAEMTTLLVNNRFVDALVAWYVSERKGNRTLLYFGHEQATQ